VGEVEAVRVDAKLATRQLHAVTVRASRHVLRRGEQLGADAVSAKVVSYVDAL
jgi:hypothetical protein